MLDNEPNWKAFASVMFPSNPETHSLAYYSPWILGGTNSAARIALEQINYRVPAGFPTGTTAANRAVRTDIWNKRTSVYGSDHPGGANLAFCAWKRGFLQQNLDLLTLQALATKNSGEVVTMP